MDMGRIEQIFAPRHQSYALSGIVQHGTKVITGGSFFARQNNIAENRGVRPHAQSMYGNKAMVDTLLRIAEAAGPARFVSGGTSQTKRDADILFGEK